MAYAIPDYSPHLVDEAGRALAGATESADFLAAERLAGSDIIDNWRSAHAYPLNIFYMTLRNRTVRVDPDGIVAQRIKRLSSIDGKLHRYDWLRLSEMQDVAGCRTIVSSVEQVTKLVEGYKRRYSDHILDDESDYIRNPKADGYRSHHLIYRYNNEATPVYNGLKVEMQFRSELQHCWATAVETADTFYKQGLKAHSGSPDWRRFFALMGAAIAIREGGKRVPRTPREWTELIDALRRLANRLDVQTRLTAFGQALDIIGDESVRRRRIKYVILVLDPAEGTESLKLFGYQAGQIEEAANQYAEFEQEASNGTDAVLVSVSDVFNLRQAYPNYYLDTTMFLDTLLSFIG